MRKDRYLIILLPAEKGDYHAYSKSRFADKQILWQENL